MNRVSTHGLFALAVGFGIFCAILRPNTVWASKESAVPVACLKERLQSIGYSGYRFVPEKIEDSLFVSKIAPDFLPSSVRAHARITTDAYFSPKKSHAQRGWLRDRGPVRILDGEGNLVLVEYFSLNNFPDAEPFTGSVESAPNPDPDGFFWKRYESNGKSAWIKTKRLPLLMQGGNAIGVGNHLLIGEEIFTMNSINRDQVEREILPSAKTEDRNPLRSFFDQLFLNGYHPRHKDEVVRILSETLRIPLENILVMPWLPGNRVGHVDLYVGALDANTLAIPRMPEYAIEALKYERDRLYCRRLNEFLDEQSQRLNTTTGKTIVRVPMQPPKNLSPSSIPHRLEFDATLISPVNWLNHAGTLYVPVDDSRPSVGVRKVDGKWINELYDSGYVPDTIRKRIQMETSQILSEHGYRIEFKQQPSGEHGSGGAFHCLTWQLCLP